MAELTLPGAQGWGWDEPPGCLCLLLCGLLGCQATEPSWSMDFSTSLRFKQLFSSIMGAFKVIGSLKPGGTSLLSSSAREAL